MRSCALFIHSYARDHIAVQTLIIPSVHSDEPARKEEDISVAMYENLLICQLIVIFKRVYTVGGRISCVRCTRMI